MRRGFGSGKPRARFAASFDIDIGGETPWFERAASGLLLQLYVQLLDNGHDLRVERLAGIALDHRHGLREGQRTPVLPVAGQGIEAIDHAENARPNGNLFALQTRWIAAAIPLFV